MPSSSSATDTTPLLGNGTRQNQQDRKQGLFGVRQRLLKMTPLQSFLSLLTLAALTGVIVFVLIKTNLPKDIPPERRDWLKFPRSAEDVQHLSILLNAYVSEHYYNVLFCFIATYVAMQAFAIPGSVMLSVLGGALFKFWVGFPVVLMCATVGSTICYCLSYYLMHPIVEKYLQKRVLQLQAKIDAKRDQLFFYFAFLRVTPFIPNWFMNVASPHLGISILIFFFGTMIGVLPNSLVTVQAGVALAALASPDDFTLLTPQNIIMTVVVCVCLLLPIALHHFHGDKEEVKDAHEDADEDAAARV